MRAHEGTTLEHLWSHGYCSVATSHSYRQALAVLRDTARPFFASSPEHKQRHHHSASARGYRARGIEYAATPDRPDRNEVFTLAWQ